MLVFLCFFITIPVGVNIVGPGPWHALLFGAFLRLLVLIGDQMLESLLTAPVFDVSRLLGLDVIRNLLKGFIGQRLWLRQLILGNRLYFGRFLSDLVEFLPLFGVHRVLDHRLHRLEWVVLLINNENLGIIDTYSWVILAWTWYKCRKMFVFHQKVHSYSLACLSLLL